MALANINQIDIDGDKNVVVQYANNSTITINTQDNEKLLEFFETHKTQMDNILELLKGRQELQQFAQEIYNIQTVQTANFNSPSVAHYHITAGQARFEVNSQDIAQRIFDGLRKSLNVLVITETNNDFMAGKATEMPCGTMLTHYGIALEHWKPFGVETIHDLLKELSEKNNYKIKVSYVGNGLKSDLHEWKNRRRDFIVLIDVLALARPENKELACVFDDNDVGGCLLLWNDAQSAQACQTKDAHKTAIFKTLCANVHQFDKYCKGLKSYKGLLQVGFEVQNKADFFRRLTQIVAYTDILTFDDSHINSIQVNQKL